MLLYPWNKNGMPWKWGIIKKNLGELKLWWWKCKPQKSCCFCQWEGSLLTLSRSTKWTQKCDYFYIFKKEAWKIIWSQCSSFSVCICATRFLPNDSSLLSFVHLISKLFLRTSSESRNWGNRMIETHFFPKSYINHHYHQQIDVLIALCRKRWDGVLQGPLTQYGMAGFLSFKGSVSLNKEPCT